MPPEDSDLYEESDEEVRESMRQQAREGVLGTMALPGYHGKGFPNQQAGGSSSSDASSSKSIRIKFTMQS